MRQLQENADKKSVEEENLRLEKRKMQLGIRAFSIFVIIAIIALTFFILSIIITFLN